MNKPNPYEEYMREEAETLPAVVPLAPVETMPEEFSRSTMLALRTQQEILEMKLDPDDEHYEAELRAKTAMAGTQINAQLKSDEQRLKRQIASISYYAELKKALEDFRASRSIHGSGGGG
jgi:septal ring factor EnvC (AmiA/AmiB activator)